MTDKELWLIVRRALMMVVKAIERKYGKGEQVQLEPSEEVHVSYIADD